MKMKRYFAADSRQALRELRDEQGPDAVILSNRRVNGGVEIIAAMDYEDSMVSTSLGNPSQLPGNDPLSAIDPYKNDLYSRPTLSGSASSPSSRADDAAEPEIVTRNTDAPGARYLSKEDQPAESSSVLSKIQDELNGLRNIMEAPLMQFAWGEMRQVQPLYASLLKQLMTLGLSSIVSQNIAKKMVDQGLDKNSWLEALKLVAKLLPINNEDILSHGGIVALVGPTGVGKTTTIAKLAARYALKHGRRGITLITTDNFRVGAHEQLRTYGRIIGVPVHVATDKEELSHLLKEAQSRSNTNQLTLIDTAGICQNDDRLAEQLAILDVDDIDIKNYLVMSATGQINLQNDVIRAFSSSHLNGCVLTKIDETASLGESISVLMQNELPVAFVCDGQKVPDDLHLARGRLLVKEAVKLMRKFNKSPSAEQLAFTFGGMATNANV